MATPPSSLARPRAELSMRLATVTVTYRPDLALLARQWQALPPGIAKIAVDNASGAIDALRALAANHEVVLLENAANRGLAAANNRGMERAIASGCTHVLLLDQDSVPEPGSVETLVAAYEALERDGRRPGLVGPALRDPQTGLEHGFHLMRAGRWARAHAGIDSAPFAVASINGSGSLFDLGRVSELGGLEESFFIDHVDTEWSFRVAHAGLALFAVPAARFEHRMGDRSLRFWLLGWRLWPYRSPARHRTLFRNACRLARRDYVPLVWKVWMVAKLAATLIVHLLFDPSRFLQVRAMAGGLADGIRDRGEPA